MCLCLTVTMSHGAAPRMDRFPDRGFVGSGAPGGIRTPDLQLRRLPLYPSELQARGLSLPYLIAGVKQGTDTDDIQSVLGAASGPAGPREMQKDQGSARCGHEAPSAIRRIPDDFKSATTLETWLYKNISRQVIFLQRLAFRCRISVRDRWRAWTKCPPQSAKKNTSSTARTLTNFSLPCASASTGSPALCFATEPSSTTS